MIKYFAGGGAVLFVAFIVVSVSGWYPVAIVDGAPVWFRTWKKAERASLQFVATQSSRQGIELIDFDSAQGAVFLLGVKRDTLTFLIEDAVLRRRGSEIIDDFHMRSTARVDAALGDSGSFERGARLVYDLSEADFKKLVLMPQARVDVLRDEFMQDGEFEAWLADAVRAASIKIFFLPFRWDGEQVR